MQNANLNSKSQVLPFFLFSQKYNSAGTGMLCFVLLAVRLHRTVQLPHGPPEGRQKGVLRGGALDRLRVCELAVCTVCTVCTVCAVCTVCTVCAICTVCTECTGCAICTVCTVFQHVRMYTIYILVRSAGCRPPRAREHFMFGATSARPSPLPFIWHLTSRRLVARLAPASGKEATWTAVALKPCMSQ